MHAKGRTLANIILTYSQRQRKMFAFQTFPVLNILFMYVYDVVEENVLM